MRNPLFKFSLALLCALASGAASPATIGCAAGAPGKALICGGGGTAAWTTIGIPAASITDSTASGRALLSAVDTAAQRTALGLAAIYAPLAHNQGLGTITGLSGGAIPFGATGALSQDATGLVWDAANRRLGIRTATPSAGITIKGTAQTDGPTYEAELLGTTGWTVNTGWTEAPDDVFSHAAGSSVATLTHSATIANGSTYRVTLTIAGRTTGSVIISLGGQSSASLTASAGWTPTAASTAAFTITPTVDFNGAISVTSLKRISAWQLATQQMLDASGTVRGEWRVAALSGLTSIGVGAAGHAVSLTQSVFIGDGTAANWRDGDLNTMIGYQSGTSQFSGSGNTYLGRYAGGGSLVADNSTAIGVNAGRVTGDLSVYVGQNAGYSATGQYETIIGAGAGTSLTTGIRTVVIGAGVDVPSATTDGQVNIANLLYGTGATGTGTTPAGLVGIGIAAPVARLDVVGGASEDLRLRYDATHYAALNVSAAGDLSITTTNNKILIGNAVRTPASGTAACTVGEVAYDASYWYWCAATNTWRRAAGATW